MAEILDEVVPSEGGTRAASMSALASAAPTTTRPPATTRARRAAPGRPATRPAAPRRRYSEYAAEYSYVAADLRRILIVAGVLIALLIALSFFIQ